MFLFRYGFRHLCLCFSVISGWVSGFVCISGLCFGLSLRFGLVVLDLLVSIWVAHISGFSNLVFAHISAHFFLFFFASS